MGKGDDGIFGLRRNELGFLVLAQTALKDSHLLTENLNKEVENLVSIAQDESQSAAAQSARAIAGGKVFMMILTGVGLIGAASPTLRSPIESGPTAVWSPCFATRQ